jgi:hypothetical protein
MIEPAEALAYARRGVERVRERLTRRARRRRVEREAALGRLLAAKEAAGERLGRREREDAGTGGHRAERGPGDAETAAPVGVATATLERTGTETAAEAPPRAEERPPRVVWNRSVPGVTPRADGGGREAERPSPAAPPPAETPAATPEGTSTSRLLDAKRRRARKQDDK